MLASKKLRTHAPACSAPSVQVNVVFGRKHCSTPAFSIRQNLQVLHAYNVLVGDIGGTNARFALWQIQEAGGSKELSSKIYPTTLFKTFEEVVAAFYQEEVGKQDRPAAVAIAVAGAVEGNACMMTNANMLVDGDALSAHFKTKVRVLNDFEAVGYGIPALPASDLMKLNGPEPMPKAPKVVMGPGTGLGAAQLAWDSGSQRYTVLPGEGAHASFAPRGWKQAALATWVSARNSGHCEVEQVACGPGLELIYEFLMSDELANRPEVLGKAVKKTAPEISMNALNGTDPLAVEAVDMMLAIVGAEAGAMALRCLARGGVYIAGGIAPKLLPRSLSLVEGFLMRQGRPRFARLLEEMPLYIILNQKVGQIGAREVATALAETPGGVASRL